MLLSHCLEQGQNHISQKGKMSLPEYHGPISLLPTLAKYQFFHLPRAPLWFAWD
jgi:hypothetical protein